MTEEKRLFFRRKSLKEEKERELARVRADYDLKIDEVERELMGYQTAYCVDAKSFLEAMAQIISNKTGDVYRGICVLNTTAMLESRIAKVNGASVEVYPYKIGVFKDNMQSVFDNDWLFCGDICMPDTGECLIMNDYLSDIIEVRHPLDFDGGIYHSCGFDISKCLYLQEFMLSLTGYCDEDMRISSDNMSKAAEDFVGFSKGGAVKKKGRKS